MVKPGGENTMLGQWRVAVRQAEEAIRAGRLEDAYAFVNRPEVADHQQAVQLRGRVVRDLVERGIRRAEADDLEGGVRDLELAESYGAAPDRLASARLRIAEITAKELQAELDLGRPERLPARIDRLEASKIHAPALRRLRETAELWKRALQEGRKGEFGKAFDWIAQAERLASGDAKTAVREARKNLESGQKQVQASIDQLYSALTKRSWPEVLRACDEVLGVLPEHPAALSARSKAWREVAAIAPAATLAAAGARAAAPAPGEVNRPLNWLRGTRAGTEDAAAQNGRMESIFDPPSAGGALVVENTPEAQPRDRFLLWVDTVGGYLVCPKSEVTIGRAGQDGSADIPILGDLSRKHATLSRSGDAYILKAHENTFVNGKRVDSCPLRDRDIVRLGGSVELEFRQPSPISGTARLQIVSRHRLPLTVDGVILMAETCIISRSHQAHVHSPGLRDPAVLYHQGETLWLKCAGEFEADGRRAVGRTALAQRSNVVGEGFSFSIEPLESKLSGT